MPCHNDLLEHTVLATCVIRSRISIPRMDEVVSTGIEALRRRTAPGSAPRLTAEQRGHLVDALAKGAPAFGFLGEVWTTKRIATIIKELFGVSSHPAHVSRLVRALGQSVQLPVTQATQRDEAAIQAWHDERWPALKKRLKQKDGRSSG